MQRTLFLRASLGVLLLVLAGCCANVACDNRDKDADTLFFRFADSVSPRVIDTLYIVRTYTPIETPTSTPASLLPVRDTARLISNPDSIELSRILYIRNSAPFTATANRKLDAYTYQIYALDSIDGARKVFNFDIQNIRLAGGFRDADGCCTYYQNTQKSFNLNGVPTGELASDNNERRYTELRP